MTTKLQYLTRQLVAGEPVDTRLNLIESAAEDVMSGQVTPIQIASFLTALAIRGESPALVASFARVLRKKAHPFHSPGGVVLDTCGTGGDNSGTFNISTAAAFVAAGAGVRVAKHGNRSMTSRCGSSDVLQELGVPVDCSTETMEKALNKAGICFLHAQCYHEGMKHVAEVRQQLGFRTMFNLLGPLANPAGANRQLLGVFGRKEARLVAEVLHLLETDGALVVHGSDGLDEITTTGDTWGYRVRRTEVEEILIKPRLLGFDLAKPENLKGGDAAENARLIIAILEGAEGPRTDIVLLNAGAAVHVAGLAPTLGKGVELARKSIAEGRAMGCLEALRSVTAEKTAS